MRPIHQILIATGCALMLATATSGEDWPMWGGDADRNMASQENTSIPVDFHPGELIGRSDQIDPESTSKIKWVAKLGSQTYGNPVVTQGLVLVGTNNETPQDPKYTGDRACLYALEEATGKLVWQLNIPKLGSGKVGDWEFLGICSSPAVQGDRVYIVTNLCEVICLDLKGMANGNDGVQDEKEYYGVEELGDADADVIWRYNMSDELGVFPHNITSTSPLIHDGRVYVATSNGVDWSHINIVNPLAPSLIALDAETGELVGEEGAGISQNLLHCNWSSPAYGEFAGQPTIVFGGGDGLLYGFDPTTVKDEDEYDILPTLWKIDGNPESYRIGEDGKPLKYATPPGPSEFIGTPVIHDGLVYAMIGQDPEHGDGVGALICVDPSQIDEDGQPKLVWRDTTVERSVSTMSIVDGLAYAADYAGKVYCFDAKTGEKKWEHDTLAHIWASTYVADGKVIIGNEDGIVTILQTGPEKKLLAEVEFPSKVYSTAVLANGVMYIATPSHLFAISADAE